jgi:tetratricopeptide (TPR) repeat protein
MMEAHMLKKTAGAIILAALVSLSVPTFAREGVVKGSYVTLRSEGRFNSPIIGRKMRGDTYRILYEDRKWIKVSFEDGVVGWLYQTSTELSADEPPAPAAETASATVEPPAKEPVSQAKAPEKEAAKASDKKAEPAKASPEKAVKTDDKTAAKKTEPAKDSKVSDKKAEPAKASPEKAVKTDDKTAAKKAEPAKDSKASDKKAEPVKALSDKTGKTDDKAAAKTAEPAVKMAKPIPASVVEVSGSAEELYNEAIQLYEKKQYVQALDKNMLAIKKAPQNAEILNNIGNCQFKLGRIDEALTSWKEALKISPRSGKISNNLGIAYYQLDKNKDAIEYYKKAILFEPDFPDPYYNLASVYGFTGKFEDAIMNYRKFLEFSPDAVMKKLADERIAYCERQIAKTGKKN